MHIQMFSVILCDLQAAVRCETRCSGPIGDSPAPHHALLSAHRSSRCYGRERPVQASASPRVERTDPPCYDLACEIQWTFG
jgi:hypothetical protein